jgi:hypothetical protein
MYNLTFRISRTILSSSLPLKTGFYNNCKVSLICCFYSIVNLLNTFDFGSFEGNYADDSKHSVTIGIVFATSET